MDVRPYLVIPKLIKQPTWGGDYIAIYKEWENHPELFSAKIGQAYELFSGSNLSLLESSLDPQFAGELTDAKAVCSPTSPPNTLSLQKLIRHDPQHILGKDYVEHFGPYMKLLIKFTQALGNSFQLHVKEGTKYPKWKPKPESWYFFEPGSITLGAKKNCDWNIYQEVCLELEKQINNLGLDMQEGILSYDQAQAKVEELLKHYDPWQFVNNLNVPKETLIDLSPCGIHHSWEENPDHAPLGNVVYELQVDVPDEAATIRNFDKGKLDREGHARPLQIHDYFTFIDRNPKANDPKAHLTKPQILKDVFDYRLTRLLKTKHYELRKVDFLLPTAVFSEKILQFRHVFVKEGKITLSTDRDNLVLSRGHSAFIPAGVFEYEIRTVGNSTSVLISN